MIIVWFCLNGPVLADPNAAQFAADRARLERIVATENLDTSVPRPSWAQWIVDVGNEVARAFATLIGDNISLAGSVVEFLGALLFLIVAVVLGALIWSFWRRRRKPPSSAEKVATLAGQVQVSSSVDWEVELEKCLARHDIRGALEALWFFLAVGLGQTTVDPSATTRELVLRAEARPERRRDLLREIRPLDRMIYGGTKPAADDVRALHQRLREVMA